MFGASDLPAIFADWGDSVVFGGVTASGALDEPVEIVVADQGFGGIESSMPSVRIPFNAFDPMPEADDAITVNGTEYLVGKVTAIGDGAIVQIQLKAAS